MTLTLHPNWHGIMLRAWSMRFLLISMVAFGLDTAYPAISAWWPFGQGTLAAIGFATGALVAVSRVIPQRNLPGVS